MKPQQADRPRDDAANWTVEMLPGCRTMFGGKMRRPYERFRVGSYHGERLIDRHIARRVKDGD
ncbi:MAG TPA: hypothetical protein VFN18_01260 [Solirubrobacterales bacterium]|nr:hypothetical protein [Solirubrobacterales bacterium]